jgi:hypothetical protein
MAGTWLVMALVGVASAGEPAWSELRAVSGWVALATRASEVGEVHVYTKKIDEVPCLKGSVAADVRPEELLAVVRDVAGSMAWTSADLTASDVLRQGSDSVDFFQYLDVPDWTMVADRYWILRANWGPAAGAGLGFWWHRIDRAVAYGEVHDRVLATNDRAVEPPINWGEWVFEPKGQGSLVHYVACADVGGSIPTSIQRFVATRTLPDTVTDLIREAQRRRSG